MVRLRRQQWWLFCVAGLIFNLQTCNALKTFTKATTTTTTEPTTDTENEEQTTSAAPSSTKPPLTGIPQIDYIWDPNLPRELNGYNLTDYPFLVTTPPSEQISFKCNGLHDGFYASVAYKCQLYHHCLYGTRYDFLCANFTAFDQKTFICHFASEVDCANSHKYWGRNDALYKATTTTSTTTTTTPAPPTQPPSRSIRRRRPFRWRRPQQYEYYYDDEYYESDVYDEQQRDVGRRRKRPQQQPSRHQQQYDDYDDRYDYRRDYDEYDNPRSKPYDRPRGYAQRRRPLARTPGRKQPTQQPQETLVQPSQKSKTASVYDRPRMPPKIRRPVPLNIREKYDYKPPNTSDITPTPSDIYYTDYEEEGEEVANQSQQPKIEAQGKLFQKKPQTQAPLPVNERPLIKQLSNDNRSVSTKTLRTVQNERVRRPIGLDSYDYGYKPIQPVETRPRHELRRPTASSTPQPIDVQEDEYYEDDDYDVPETQTKRVINTTATNVRPVPPKSSRPLLRVVKRPFLPSRGGSPYLPRGLQPIGRKVKIENPSDVEPADNIDTTAAYYEKNLQIKPKDEQHRRKQEPTYQQTSQYLPESHKIAKPTEERSHIRHFPDINENEYDVTLNDALNPTLPNLAPLRHSPSGFVIPKLQPTAYSVNGQSYRGQTYYSDSSPSDAHVLRSHITRRGYQ